MKKKALVLSYASAMTLYSTFAPEIAYAVTASQSSLTFSEDVPEVCGINVTDGSNGKVRLRNYTGVTSSSTGFVPVSNVGASRNISVWFEVDNVEAEEVTGESNTLNTDVRIAYATSDSSIFNDSFTSLYSDAANYLDESSASSVTSGVALYPVALVNKDTSNFVSESTVTVNATIHVKCSD